MSDRTIARLVVATTQQLSQNMLRILFTVENLAEIAGGKFDDRLMIAFPDLQTKVHNPPEIKSGRVHWPIDSGVRREYTISKIENEMLAIDFFIHEGGVAAQWALKAHPGDELWASGPKSDTQVPADVAFWVMLGDESALPAIERNLRQLEPATRGVVAIEIGSAADQRELKHPSGVEVHWLKREKHFNELLADFLRAVDLPASGTYVWAAGERSAMKPIRIWARENGFDRTNCNISGYWRY